MLYLASTSMENLDFWRRISLLVALKEQGGEPEMTKLAPRFTNRYFTETLLVNS